MLFRLSVSVSLVLATIGAGWLPTAADGAPIAPTRASTSAFGANAKGKPLRLPANRKRVSLYELRERGTVTHFAAYLDGKGGGKGRHQQVRLVLYDDRKGAPRRLLGSTKSYRVSKGAAGRWVELRLINPVELAPGRYHLGIHSGVNGLVARYGIVRGPAKLRQNRNVFRAGPTRVFGAAATTTAGKIAVKAMYEYAAAGLPNSDTTPPSVPANLAVSSKRQTSVSLIWEPSTDDVGVTGYRLFVDAVGVTSTEALVHTFTGLACGTSHDFGVEAYDAAGNASGRASARAETDVCDAPSPPPPTTSPPAPPAPSDTSPPVIAGVQAKPTTTSAYVTWATDEPATSGVDYGTSPAYGQTAGQETHTTAHGVSLANLACETTYHFRVRSTDPSGNVASSNGGTFATGSCPAPGAPVVDVWYGDNQTFGHLGRPQQWINVLGHAADPDGFTHIRYSLNSGPWTLLTIAPGANLRIGRYGDFNVEVPWAELLPGTNQITIVAKDWYGLETSHNVAVTYVPGILWPMPYDVAWGSALRLSDVAQAVDGRWTLSQAGVRTAEPGYDRTIAIGDLTWVDYEVTVPITVHSLDLASPHSGVGFAVGWRGHEGGDRPRSDWPLGGLCFYFRDFPNPHRLWLMKNPWPFFIAYGAPTNWLELDVTYKWKFRAKAITSSPGDARYQCKVWPAGTAEPAAWNIEADMPARTGSLFLVADYADVTFGDVSVRPLP